MNRLAWIGVCCTLLAAASLAGATSGYDAASADRELTVTLTDDDRADFGVETRATSKYGCSAEVTVTNRFATPIETVSVEGSHQGASENHTRETAVIENLGPGESETVTVSLDKFAGRSEVTIDAVAGDVSVDLTRSVDTTATPGCERRGKSPDRRSRFAVGT